MSKSKRVGVVLGIFGIADSLYLLLANSLLCSADVCGSLSILFLPREVPAALGLIWFAFSLAVFLRGFENRVCLHLWQFSGVFGVAFLGTYAVINSYFCPFCFTAYALGMAQIAVSERIFNEEDYL